MGVASRSRGEKKLPIPAAAGFLALYKILFYF